MTTIYVNNVLAVKQEIEFANYLSLQQFKDSFFLPLAGSLDKFEKIKKLYTQVLNDSNIIILPITNLREQESIPFTKRYHLLRPKNIVKYLNDFEEYFKFIQVKEANLTSLDKELAGPFRNGYFKKDAIYIINSDLRLDHFEDVVAGIDNSLICYKKVISSHAVSYFASILKKEFKKYAKLYPRRFSNYYNMYYSVGTTAIQFKDKV